jgi:inorganic pyrophosphatase
MPPLSRSIARALSTATPAFPPPQFFKSGGSRISPWHDIPLKTSIPGIFNCVIEIPNGGRPKMEIDTGAPHNPIIQDKTKQKTPRFYALDSLSNYGALPQTYEDPDHKDAWTGLLGDGDPIDVCDISSTPRPSGSVYRVKVLGALAMIDGGETDWKLLAVRTDDPLAALVEDVEGAGVPDAVKKAMDDIRHWFRVYKVPEGKGENDFAFDGKWLDKATALKVIEVRGAQATALTALPSHLTPPSSPAPTHTHTLFSPPPFLH